MNWRRKIFFIFLVLLPEIFSQSVHIEDTAKRTVLICSEYSNEDSVNEEQIRSDKCTFSYVEIDEPNDIRIAPTTVKNFDYDGNANDIDASGFITTVNFVSSRLSSLPSQIFKRFINIKTLNCDGVNLQTLPAGSMANASNLVDFSCNSNYVKLLEARLFGNCTKLESIDISINDIEEIDATTFNGLSQLKKLLLYDNKLSSLSEDLFLDLINLEEINLSNNQIQIVDVKLFSMCKLLKYIYINDNHIGNMHESSFENNENVVLLEVSNNRLTSLKLNLSSSGLYANHNQLKSIHLGSIGYLSFYNNSISDVIFTVEHDVLSLNMSRNNLNADTLLNSSIMRCISLKSLDLSFNNLGRLNVSTFLELNELQILNLQSTNLSRIDYGLFQHQTKLEQMDISYNQLGTSGEFDLSKFSRLRQLNALYIEGNNITKFNYEKIKTIFPQLNIIGYTDNPWTCSYLILINKFMADHKIEIDHLVSEKTRSNVDGIACSDDDDNKVNSGVNYEDKLHSTNSIRHKLQAGDNELSVISKKFEEILMNMSSMSSSNKRNDDYVSKSELINELSMMKSSIASLQGDFLSILKRLDKLPPHDGMIEAIKSIQNTSDQMKVMEQKLHGVERTLEEFKNDTKHQIERKQQQTDTTSTISANSKDDFLQIAMISTIFVIVCGFVAIYIIKLLARRHHHHHLRDFRTTYTDGDTIDDNTFL